MKRITLVPGDGIGPEITEATVRVVEAAGASIEWERAEVGAAELERSGRLIPDAFFESAKANCVVLKGPVTTPIGGGFRSVNVTIREKLDLYANVRLARSIPGIKTHYTDVDLAIVRESTEGLYSGIERETGTGLVESIKTTSAKASKRVGRFAFKIAQKLDKRKVTVVHKANILKKGDGLFLRSIEEVAKEYKEIEIESMLIDNTCNQLVINPEQFQVIVTTNLYGDIISDLCAGLIGGLALMPGANFGDSIVVFEPAHGSAPDIAGRGIANPTAHMLSAAWMLDHIGMSEQASTIRDTIYSVLRVGEALTPDLGGDSTTKEFTDAVIEHICK